MNNPAASSGISVSPEGIILFAVSGGEFDPERFKDWLFIAGGLIR
jgi:hypothetical protein